MDRLNASWNSWNSSTICDVHTHARNTSHMGQVVQLFQALDSNADHAHQAGGISALLLLTTCARRGGVMWLRSPSLVPDRLTTGQGGGVAGHRVASDGTPSKNCLGPSRCHPVAGALVPRRSISE